MTSLGIYIDDLCNSWMATCMYMQTLNFSLDLYVKERQLLKSIRKPIHIRHWLSKVQYPLHRHVAMLTFHVVIVLRIALAAIYIYTHIHTYIHTYIHAYIHTYIHTYILN